MFYVSEKDSGGEDFRIVDISRGKAFLTLIDWSSGPTASGTAY
jgi:hypothetical protein